jgi:hypothetical protein
MHEIPIERSIRRRKSTQYRFDISPREYTDFIEGIRLGLSVEDSAWNAKLTPRRVWDWLKKGDTYAEISDDLVPHSSAWQYARFWQDYMHAKANMTARHVANIDHCSRTPATSSGQWQASKYLLSVKNPAQWSEQHQIEKITDQKIIQMVKFCLEHSPTPLWSEQFVTIVGLLPSLKLHEADTYEA